MKNMIMILFCIALAGCKFKEPRHPNDVLVRIDIHVYLDTVRASIPAVPPVPKPPLKRARVGPPRKKCHCKVYPKVTHAGFDPTW